jgi:hypothetical protein
MTDIVEQLEHHASCNAGFDDGELTTKAAAEIERLRAALTYEENRFNRVGTHGPDCYKWGPSHYDCAMREIESLQDKLAGTIGVLEARNREIERLGQRFHEVSVDWQCSQAREARLLEQNICLRVSLVKWRSKEWPGTDQAAVVARDFPTIPTGDTALKEVVKQAKREALLEAAGNGEFGTNSYLVRRELRSMAEGIE